MKLPFKKSPADIPRRRLNQAGDERRIRTAETEQLENSTFRRNRTLTGSLSSSVRSATELRGDLQSSRTQAHHLALQRRKIFSVLLATLAVTGVLAALLFDFTARPLVTAVSLDLQTDAIRYQQAIDTYLSQHPVERLRIMLNEAQLQVYLQQTVPEVATATQEGGAGFGVTEYRLTMRHPIAGWVIGGKQYFVDAVGVPFEKNYYETPAVNVVDQSGVQQTGGTVIASSRFLTFVGRTVSLAAKEGMMVKQAILPVGTTRELEVILDKYSYPIKFSLDRPVGEQVEDMQRAIGYFDAKKQTPQYIDVRVSGRAYYR